LRGENLGADMLVQAFYARGGVGGVADNAEYKMAAPARIAHIEISRFQSDAQGGFEHGMPFPECPDSLRCIQGCEYGFHSDSAIGAPRGPGAHDRVGAEFGHVHLMPLEGLGERVEIVVKEYS